MFLRLCVMASTLLAALVPSGVCSSPKLAVSSAVADVRTLPSDSRVRVRYLSLYHLHGEEREELLKALVFHVNQLSKEVELVKLRLVNPHLVRLDIADPIWDAQVYDRLADGDFYFSTKAITTVVVTEKKHWPGGKWKDGQEYGAQDYEEKVEKKVAQTITAPWLDPGEIGELVRLTQSRAPILRADWFIVQTAAQVDRVVGYYDLLGAKDRDEFERIVGVDRKAAARLKKETAAMLSRSGVAINNRQVLRLQALTGSYWMTLDSQKSQDTGNAIRLLNGDFKHEAEEIFGTLPNGLFAYFLSDAGGKRQESVPDTIAHDSRSTSNDLRIHPGISCIRCHVEGIRPIADTGRALFAGDPIVLQSPIYEKYKRLTRLYLSDLQKHIRRDNEDLADVLRRINGLTPQENAKLFARVWSRYVDEDLGLEASARELGVTKNRLLAVLNEQLKRQGSLDHVAAMFLAGLPVRREHFEELFGTLSLSVAEK